jgi:hypothetical protein
LNWRDNIRPTFLALLISFCASYASIAQNSSFEFWPETDIWYRIDPSWRLSSFIPFTIYHQSGNADLNIYLQADYAWGKTKYLHFARLYNESRAQLMKAWMVRGGFMEGWGLGERADEYTEDMLFAEIHRRIPLGEKFLISQRIRTDLRWVGQDPEFSYKIRYRAMLEKEYTDGNFSAVPYVNAELFWDSRYTTINRVRVAGGTTLSLGPTFAIECNITYQYDSHYNTQNLYVVNLILHVFFD